MSNKTTDPYPYSVTVSLSLQHLAQSLSAVAAHMEPQAAAQTCDQAAVTLTQVMSKTTLALEFEYLAQGLLAVAARMEPKEGAHACGQAAATLSRAMRERTHPLELQPIAQGLSAVAVRMEPQQAAAILTQAMNKTTEPAAVRYLAQGLSAVATRLEPQQAASTLTQAMSKTADPVALLYLAEILPAGVARLEPQPAAAAAATFTQAMSKATAPLHSQPLVQGLSAVLCREPSMTTRQRLLSATATVAALADTGLPFAALVSAQPALRPLPPPLSPQMLVDLLKHPFCVGEARRLVLAQLSRHYHRPFADQWEFVEYVHQHQLDLDLITPPERPRLVP
jgi:hypothetical protein